MNRSLPGVLYLVATPIGNLEDITLRALRILREVDFVICEDSRRSGMLLKHFEIKKPFRSCHDHTAEPKLQEILEELEAGQSAALVSDAGTPLVSDPGFPLVRRAIQRGIKVEAIPGPCALVNALIVSGLPMHAFSFRGYLPQKDKARRDALDRLKDEPNTFIFYESPYRILKCLKDLLEILGDRQISVSREMTKKFEETVRGPVSEVLTAFDGKETLGEFTVVVSGKGVVRGSPARFPVERGERDE